MGGCGCDGGWKGCLLLTLKTTKFLGKDLICLNLFDKIFWQMRGQMDHPSRVSLSGQGVCLGRGCLVLILKTITLRKNTFYAFDLFDRILDFYDYVRFFQKILILYDIAWKNSKNGKSGSVSQVSRVSLRRLISITLLRLIRIDLTFSSNFLNN